MLHFRWETSLLGRPIGPCGAKRPPWPGGFAEGAWGSRTTYWVSWQSARSIAPAASASLQTLLTFGTRQASVRRAPIEPSTSATQRTTTPPNARSASAGAGAATMTSGGVPRGSAGVWMPLARQLLLGRSAGLTKLLSHGVWRLCIRRLRSPLWWAGRCVVRMAGLTKRAQLWHRTRWPEARGHTQ